MKEHFDNTVGPEIGKKKSGRLNTTALINLILLIVGFTGSALISTQIFASRMDYATWLGEPLIGKFYNPFSIIDWYKNYFIYVKEDLKISLLLGFLLCLFPIFLICIIHAAKNGSTLKGNKYLHGSARWAEKDDILQMSLIPKDKKTPPQGVFVGGWRDKPKTLHDKGHLFYLRHNGPEHILCVAPTRSGKGVGLVNPTLLTWPESLFATDIKGELYALTAGWRQKYAKNKVLKFDPATKRECVDPEKGIYNSVRWNPLDEIRAEGFIEQKYDHKKKKLVESVCDGSEEYSDVVTIVNMLVDPKGEGIEKLDFWGQTARQLLIGAIIHLKHNLPVDECNLKNVYMLLSGLINTKAIREGKPNTPISTKDLYADMKLGLDKDGKKYKLSNIVMAEGEEMYNAPSEQGGSTLSTAKTFLQTYTETIVAENTATSDFHIKQIMNSEQPVSLYLIVSPAKKDDLNPLIRLMITLMITLNCAEMKFDKGRSVQGYAHRVLLMLDEFPSWGQLEKVKEAISYMAGYGLKGYFICQDMGQLQDKYGEKESISSNCHVQIFYAPLRIETAEIMSKKVGTTTIVDQTVSVSGHGLNVSKTKSARESQRALMTPDECMQMPGPKKDKNGNILEAGKMLIIIAGFPAIYGEQPLYFKIPALLARAQVEAPLGSDVLIQSQNNQITETSLLKGLNLKGN